jgi:alkyldihydroxyacetonephosphate synthase
VVHPFQLEAVVSELNDALGAAYVSARPSDRLVYAADWSWMSQVWLDRALPPAMADVIVHPGSAEEVGRVLRIAGRHGLPVVPWGGGSGSQGGAAPIYGGILLDTKRLNRILEIDEQSLTVRAEAGIIGAQLEWALNERGLTLPHYPASANCATLGGYLAARGSGVISTKYGKAEDLVLSLEVVVPGGEVIRTLPVPNHASGPSLLQLFVGSEGTLGVITEATMRIEHLPEARLFRAVLFRDLAPALEAGRRIMTARLQPCVLRLYDPASTTTMLRRVLGLEAEGACFILGFDGWAAIAAAQEARALAICAELGGEDLGRAPGEHWWEHRYDFYYPPLALTLPKMFGTIETVCTFTNIQRLYDAKKRAIEDGFARWNARYIAHFSHWFPWGVMVYDRFVIDQPPADASEALQLHNAIWTAAARASLAHGGVLNEHHGIGWKLGRLMPEQYGPAWPTLLAIKRALDPQNIMNPGKLGFPVQVAR